MVPTVKMYRQMLRLLRTGAIRSPKLKKMLETVKERTDTRW